MEQQYKYEDSKKKIINYKMFECSKNVINNENPIWKKERNGPNNETKNLLNNLE